MGIPFISIGNKEMENLKDMHIGDWVECPHCDDRHKISGGKTDGVETEMLLYYRCEGKDYLAGISGKNVMHRFNKKY